jgi:cytosine/adenosine deaminase-related metal-dependent hydrolase
MSSSHLTGKWLLAHAFADMQNAVKLSYGARVESIASVGEAEAVEDTFLLPPFSNAHDHGRGLKPLAYGAFDAALEAWVPATYTMPPTDPYLVAAAAFARMARSGIANVVHCHLSRSPDALVAEARAVKRAAEDVGIRVAFVVPLRDRNRLVYGPDQGLLSLLSAEDAARVSEHWLREIPPIAVQINNALAIAAECESDLFKIQLGPTGVERCSGALLAAIAETSHKTGRRVHIHLLESKYQRQWADKEYPQGIITHLAEVGLLSRRLTVAHGTWLRPHECELLARHGVTVSINTSSNLRLGSGLAPLETIRSSKTSFALGLDALAIDDDDDILKEMRLAYLLHRARGFDDGLTWPDIVAATTDRGAKVASVEEGSGRIAVGGPADILVLDFAAISRDLCGGLYDPLAIVQARASAQHVRDLIVNGRTVVQSGKVTGVDEEAINRALHRDLVAAAPTLQEGQPLLTRFQSALKQYYLSGCHCHGPKAVPAASH